ncbi:MAG: hypothetical protein V4677_16080 [Bacteroidota bacterium]
MKLLIFFSCFLYLSVKGQNYRHSKDKNIKTLYTVFDQLRSGNYNKDGLYKEHFYHSPAGKPDRSESEVVYYKDTLFGEFHQLLTQATNFNILPLANAKKQLGDSIVTYNYYYEGQKNTIYVLWTDTEKRKYDHIGYCLMLNGKIVSLEGYTKDKAFIRWR